LTEPPILRTAIATYRVTEALKSGRCGPSGCVSTSSICRPSAVPRADGAEQRFDVSEMAIVTSFRRKPTGKPLVLLPVVLAARFQQSALICRADAVLASAPPTSPVRRVGVRAYSQTTGVWLRGIMHDEYGIAPEQIRWVTSRGRMSPRRAEPAGVERAAPGKELVASCVTAKLDAIHRRQRRPQDAAFRPVFPGPRGLVEAFWAKHRFVPVNHLVTIRRDWSNAIPGRRHRARPPLPRRAAGRSPAADGRDPYPMSRAALQRGDRSALRYSLAQGLLPGPLTMAEIWEGLPAEVT